MQAKSTQVNIRLNESESKRLEALVKKTGKTKAKILKANLQDPIVNKEEVYDLLFKIAEAMSKYEKNDSNVEAIRKETLDICLTLNS